jgi:hypothetical protein
VGILDDRRQDHDKRPVLLTGSELFGEGLDDFGRLQKPMEVDEYQQSRAIFGGEAGYRPDCRQRIAPAGVECLGRAGHVESLLEIPDRQSPALLVTEPADFGQGIFVLVTLDPNPRKRCRDVLAQRLCKIHEWLRDGRIESQQHLTQLQPAGLNAPSNSESALIGGAGRFQPGDPLVQIDDGVGRPLEPRQPAAQCGAALGQLRAAPLRSDLLRGVAVDWGSRGWGSGRCPAQDAAARSGHAAPPCRSRCWAASS